MCFGRSILLFNLINKSDNFSFVYNCVLLCSNSTMFDVVLSGLFHIYMLTMDISQRYIFTDRHTFYKSRLTCCYIKWWYEVNMCRQQSTLCCYRTIFDFVPAYKSSYKQVPAYIYILTWLSCTTVLMYQSNPSIPITPPPRANPQVFDNFRKYATNPLGSGIKNVKMLSSRAKNQ